MTKLSRWSLYEGVLGSLLICVTVLIGSILLVFVSVVIVWLVETIRTREGVVKGK